MEMTHYFETLGKRVDESILTVRAAADDDRHQLEQRIDVAQADARHALDETEKKTDKAASEARSRWADMQRGAAAKMAEVKTKVDRRGDDINADMAELDAEMAEDDAVAAIDYAGWAIDNARLTALYALDSRARAERLVGEKAHV
jgi:hypothetical protein